MRLQPLAAHRHEVHVGKPLPFGICDADGRLLLARGQPLDSDGQLAALLERGAFVDRSGSREAVHRVGQARPQELPALWGDSLDRIGRLLRAGSGHPDFVDALDQAIDPLWALVRRDADLALFRIVHQDAVKSRQYGHRHAAHVAIAVLLAGQRLDWSRDELRRAARAALTMNLSIIELQNLLSVQEFPVSATQRQQIRSHPERSRQLLHEAGVDDADWLQAVALHHAYDDDSGYPRRGGDAGELAQLLQRADIYTAKFGARATRAPMAADAAARSIFQRDRGHPLTAALVKVFGLYPPGCVVRLASGELAVVARRTEQGSAPLAIALVTRSGDPLGTPARRHTGQPAYAVTAVLSPAALRLSLPLEQLVALMPAA
ncbi:MAG: hypothetical protein U1F56_08980 [Rubrivivax sp.]